LVCGTHFGGRLLFHKPRAQRIPQTAKEHGTQQENIEPIHHKKAIDAERGLQPCRKRCERHRKQEPKMNPHEMAIASREMVELRLLADPENAGRQKTHEIGEEARRKPD